MATAGSVIKAFYKGITYRGGSAHWAWMMHRVAGIGVFLFLLLHIFDIFLIGFGPDLFNKFLFLYHSPPFKILIILLIFGVLFHAVNGLRIILIDFFPGLTVHTGKMFWGVMLIVLPVTAFAAFGIIMSIINPPH
jgi:succinate dehydrogenase / fumarate reductase cytochrome b subunit